MGKIDWDTIDRRIDDATSKLGWNKAQHEIKTIVREIANNPQPRLTVWFGSMPESNGNRNWTVILRRAQIGDSYDWMRGDEMCIMRTEYYDQARYEADCLRFLIGEIDTKPFILDYDPDIKEPKKQKVEGV